MANIQPLRPSTGKYAARTTGLTQNQVRSLFSYEDGVLIWKKGSAGHKAGAIAGTINKGYIRIRVGKIGYLAHRIIWLFHYGYLSENDIDHIDRNPVNNRIENLRETSVQCNVRNSSVNSNNTSGCTGVFWDKSKKKWSAKMVVDQKLKKLSGDCSFEEAVFHRLAAEQCLDWEACNSSSSAFLCAMKILKKR